jgi:hypothetical protein
MKEECQEITFWYIVLIAQIDKNYTSNFCLKANQSHKCAT